MAVIRTHEAKGLPGGMIASLSVPWGFAKGDDDEGGYHLVWPRDLVEAAGALLAAGAPDDARRVLRYLMVTQEADGHWPQNMWLDGTPYWRGIQMDETAFPILLADLLRRGDALGDLVAWPMVRRAAGYLIRNGPVTPQGRWEEDGGYSPFTLAVEMAALVVAADLAEEAGEPVTGPYLRETADTWNQGIDRWTYVRGTELARKVGVEGYYARIAPPEVADADSPSRGFVPIKNRPIDQSEAPYAALVSPDALALVRFGLRAADDPRIASTVRGIDAVLKSETATGPVWHRYNEDGYGEHDDGSPFDGTGVGRGWPLLAGERAHYELAAGNLREARRLQQVIAAQAGLGGLIPEQVWDGPDIPERELWNGQPSGSAMPLVWAHGAGRDRVRQHGTLAMGLDLPAAPVLAEEAVGAPGGELPHEAPPPGTAGVVHMEAEGKRPHANHVTDQGMFGIGFEHLGRRDLRVKLVIENRVAATVARVLIVLLGGIADRRLREAFASAGQIAEGAADRPEEFCEWLGGAPIPPERGARGAGLGRGCGGPP